MDDEFYIDGDHNGGVYNHFNHNSYGYCYQSPVRYIDPNGKQVEFTYTLDFSINLNPNKGNWKEYIPFMNYPKMTIHNSGTFSNIKIGDKGLDGGIKINLLIPKLNPHNLKSPSFEEYTGTGTSYDNIKYSKEESLAQTFIDGFNNGWKDGLSSTISSEVLGTILKLKLNITSAFKVEVSKKGLGLRFFTGGKKIPNEVRIMPGNKNSPHASQQNPYVIFKKGGKYYDKNGNVITGNSPNRSEAAHIPLTEFNSKVMPKF
jgi:hypothetical protein